MEIFQRESYLGRIELCDWIWESLDVHNKKEEIVTLVCADRTKEKGTKSYSPETCEAG